MHDFWAQYSCVCLTEKMTFRRLKTSRLHCLIECLQHSEPIERLMTETVRNLLQEDLPWQQR